MTPRQKKVAYDRARYLRKKAERMLNATPDPLYALTNIDRAYIAGIIDGEGSIHMTRKIPTGTFHAFVTVGMTDKFVIEWLASKYGNKAVETVRKPQGPFKRTPKTMYRVSLQGRRACLLCELLLPYLKVKKKQAEVLMEYPCDARIKPGKKVYGSTINKIRRGLRDRLRKLNGHYYSRHHPASN